jgi:hypothetical protein
MVASIAGILPIATSCVVNAPVVADDGVLLLIHEFPSKVKLIETELAPV